MSDAHGEVLVLYIRVIFRGETREPLMEFFVVEWKVVNVVVV